METRFIVAAALAAFVVATQPAAGADILYHFSGGADGGGPFGGLVSDDKGNFYGTTAAGGLAGCDSPVDAPGCGVVFRLSPPAGGHGAWQETVLYTFTGGADGNGPLAGLVRDSAGNLFGTTEAGGVATGECFGGCGVVFEISPPSGGSGAWTETVLHSFGAVAGDGTFPAGELAIDAMGNLFGTTPSGGSDGLGTVFEISPQGGGWAETILHNFKRGDGEAPVAGLLLETDGTLFGTAELGSSGGKFCKTSIDCGTIFSLSPPAERAAAWTYTVLFRFPATGRDGLYPLATLVKDPQGRLLGTTENFGRSHGQQANGTVFRLSPPAKPGAAWTLATLFAFTDIGSYPQAPVLQGRHHMLYGTTMQAGTGVHGNGLVFALSPPAGGSGAWQETPLFSFPAIGDGEFPMAGLIANAKGWLYGTASAGGKNCAVPFCGTVFRVAPR
jgi:uncharacterized repeat protein (TIGR03803 family)